MTAQSAFPPPTEPRTCPVCHGKMWQKHLETCPGPMQRIAPPPVREECDCPAGAWHLRDCVLVTEGDTG